MKENNLITILETKLKTKKSIAKLFFLIEERKKLDDGIFFDSGLLSSSYRSHLIEMLEEGNVDDIKLEKDFEAYKNKWKESQRLIFSSTHNLSFGEFLYEFEEYLPRDIVDSIKKSESKELTGLKLKDSINIFQHYYEARCWINNQIDIQIEENHLSNGHIEALLSGRTKFEWLGNANELIGLFEVLQESKWVHNPETSERGKAALFAGTFKYPTKEMSVNNLRKVITEKNPTFAPFENIEENKS